MSHETGKGRPQYGRDGWDVQFEEWDQGIRLVPRHIVLKKGFGGILQGPFRGVLV
jgi:hypothetical protein